MLTHVVEVEAVQAEGLPVLRVRKPHDIHADRKVISLGGVNRTPGDEHLGRHEVPGAGLQWVRVRSPRPELNVMQKTHEAEPLVLVHVELCLSGVAVTRKTEIADFEAIGCLIDEHVSVESGNDRNVS
jgi:hypothetical protein